MTRLETPDGPIYADFVEYVKDGKTFADREYEKWLAERNEQSSGYRDVNGKFIREGDLVRAITQGGGIIRGKVFVERDHGAQVWRVQSSSSIGWRPFLAQLNRVERL